MKAPLSAPSAIAARLLQARTGGSPVHGDECHVPDAAAAYAVQEATLATLGPATAWKVGAASPQAAVNATPVATAIAARAAARRRGRGCTDPPLVVDAGRYPRPRRRNPGASPPSPPVRRGSGPPV